MGVMEAVWPPSARHLVWPPAALYARWDGFAIPSPIAETLWVTDDGQQVVTDTGQEVVL